MFTPQRLLIIISIYTIGVPLSSAFQNEMKNNLTVPAKIVWVEEHGTAQLPCEIPMSGEPINMILWFKDTNGIPLYSVDVRGKTISEALHSALNDNLGRRCNFHTGPPARLIIQNITAEDQGIFRCRIDFLNSPTINYRANLTLVVPPGDPQIFDSDGTVLKGTAGPYLEGQNITLACSVRRGEPDIELSWWLNDILIDNSSHPTSRNNYTIINNLHIGSATRQMRGRVYQCRAKSTSNSVPKIAYAKLHVFTKPNTVKISRTTEILSAGKSSQLMCETEGSFPAAVVTWLLDGKPIKQAAIMVGIGENSTKSTLSLRPEWNYDGKELTCRATNPHYKADPIDDYIYLKVTYAPIATVELLDGPANGNNLKEGDNIRLRCQVKANPPADNVLWYHGGHLIGRNNSSPILELDNLDASSSGQYSCYARNKEGATRSPPYILKLKYSPVCRPSWESRTLSIDTGQKVKVECHVQAVPEDSVKFTWTLSRTNQVLPIPENAFTSKGQSSYLTYSLSGDDEPGTLNCYAANPIGRQKHPCQIQLIKPRRPEAPKDCGVYNRSRILEIECEEGQSGEEYLLEVRTEDGGGQYPNDQPPFIRILNPYPKWRLHNLNPDTEYQLSVFAKNSIGLSQPPLTISKVKVSSSMEKLLGSNDKEVGISLWLIIIASVAVIIAIITIGTSVVIITSRSSKWPTQDVPLNNRTKPENTP